MTDPEAALPTAAQDAARTLVVAAPGTCTAGGWELIARLGSPTQSDSRLLALRPPDGDRVLLVGTTPDGGAHAVSWEALHQEENNCRAGLDALIAFRNAAEGADPARRAESNRWLTYFDKLQARNEARRSVVAHGTAKLHLFDGQPVRAEGASLFRAPPGDRERVTEALRLDGTQSIVPTAPPERPWAEQVWTRPVAGLWRRGRLRIEPERAVFIDEPTASTPERGDRCPPEEERERSLEHDLCANAAIRRKAQSSEIYARLLYLALENARWRHAHGTEYRGGQRSTADLVACVVGSGSYLDWAWSAPTGVIDEEVLNDLRALGWERLG